MARPAKLTPELTRKITTYIQDGNSPTKSATLVGIAPSTYFNWMSKGSNQEPRFMEFSESIKRACAQSIVNRLAHISRAADSGNWRAAAWLLERLAPEEFGRHRLKVKAIETYKQNESKAISTDRLVDLEEKIKSICKTETIITD